MEIVKRISEALRSNSHTKLLRLDIRKEEGSIRIVGTVKTYYQKQMIGSVASKTAPGIPVVNDVQVALQPENSEVTWSSQGAEPHAEHPISSPTKGPNRLSQD